MDTPTEPCVLPEAAAFVPALFELRSYLAEPGQRDVLMGMFEDMFLDAYQAGGTRIVGTFRSLDESDRWVWMRAFPDAASRGARLGNFYGGDVWKRNATACNATILDIAEALLLRELDPGKLGEPCAPPTGSPTPDRVYGLAIHPIDGQDPASLAELLGAGAIASFVSDHQENSFPRQAVRAASVVVALSQFESLDAARAWRKDIAAPGETMLLAPSARSGLR